MEDAPLKKSTKFITLPLLCIALLAASFGWRQLDFRNDIEKEHARNAILEYITTHEGEVFDYAFMADLLNLSYAKVFEHVHELVLAEKVVAHQKHLRKPLLFQTSDSINLYWRLFRKSAEHPQSELGTCGRLYPTKK